MGERILFGISEADVQYSALHRIGRKLTQDELSDVERYLRYTFEDWGNSLGKIISKLN